MIDSLLILSLSAVVIAAGGLIVGVAIDDFRDIRRRYSFKAHPYARRYRARPAVTILLIAGADSSLTKNTLEYLRMNSYRHLEIIVIGNARSRAKLTKLTQSLAKPTRPMHVFTTATPKESSLRTAYRRYGHGDIVLVLHDIDRLDEAAVKRSVWHFNTQKDITTLRARPVVASRYSSVGLLQTYVYALTYFWHKLTNSLECTQAPGNLDTSFYRAEVFLAHPMRSTMKVYAAEDVVVRRPAAKIQYPDVTSLFMAVHRQIETLASAYFFVGQRGIKKVLVIGVSLVFLLSAGYLFVALPFLLSYFIFLAAVLHQPALLFVGIAILSTYLLLGLWSDSSTSRLQKIRLTLLLPISFAPFYLFTFVYAVIIIAVVLHATWTNLFHSRAPAIKRRLAKSADEYG